jgi:hypothetical protein
MILNKNKFIAYLKQMYLVSSLTKNYNISISLVTKFIFNLN